MILPPKLITVLCFTQGFFISVSYLITRVCVKTYNEVLAEMYGGNPPPLPFPVHLVHGYGLWFLFVPIVWCAVAVACGHLDDGIAEVTNRQGIIGIVLTVLIVAGFAAVAIRALGVFL